MTQTKAVRSSILITCVFLGAAGVGPGFFNGSQAVAQQADSKPAATQESKHEEAGFPRLGQTKDDIIAKNGPPTKATTLGSGIESLEFQKGAVRLLIEISPKTKQAIQIFYFKATPFHGLQIAELLSRNAEGQRWWAKEVTEENYFFERSDGGSARGGKAGDQFKLVILSGAAAKERDANADAKVVKDALDEISGL